MIVGRGVTVGVSAGGSVVGGDGSRVGAAVGGSRTGVSVGVSMGGMGVDRSAVGATAVGGVLIQLSIEK
jgi:hypothetical protein